MRQYLDNLYNGWRNNPQTLFGNLPIDMLGENGYSLLCPPIPWFGNINSPIAVISLKPKLSDEHFLSQVLIAANSQQQWEDYYLTETYFQNLYGENPSRANYWPYLAAFIKGFQPQYNIDSPWIEVLPNSIVEFPFIQYHKRNYSHDSTPGVIRHFNDRMLLYAAAQPNSRLKVIYGTSVFNDLNPILHIGVDPCFTADAANLYHSIGNGYVAVVPQNSRNANFTYQRLYDMGNAIYNYINNNPLPQ